MAKIVINNKAKILPSTAFKFVGDMVAQFGIENSIHPKYYEFNIGALQYTIIAKRTQTSFIYTIEYTGYENV